MTHIQTRIMILGAGPSQLPAIRRAVELGYYVITVDYLPENIGHKFSHQSVNCSSVDIEGVLRIARDLKIDGIVTFASDVATATVGFVADQLGLPNGGALVAQTMSNKAKFRTFQREHGLNSPRFVVGRSGQDIAEQLVDLTPPLVFKPVDTSGSRGISRVDILDIERCAAAFKYAQSFSRSKTVCVEEFVDGVEVGGDGFLVNGRLEFAVITHKRKHGYVPMGHSLPTNISTAEQERVLAEVSRTCCAVGYAGGPLNFDVMVSPERVTVLEMSPRSGGNGIPLIIARATGVDLIKATLSFVVGEKVSFPSKAEVTRSCGSWVFGSDWAGRLEAIATEDELRAAVPEVFEYFVNCHVGAEVHEFVHSGNSLGYVLFDCPPEASYEMIVDRLMQAIRLKVG